MATTIFSNWFRGHTDLLPAPAVDDLPLPQVGVTFFVRAPHLEDDSTVSGWATISELSELLTSPHWQTPSTFVGGDLVQTATAGLAPYYVSTSDSQNFVQLAEDFLITGTGAPTATPIIALAFWYNGTLDGKYRPVISMVRLDSPVLLMADVDHPATLSSLLFFAWSEY